MGAEDGNARKAWAEGGTARVAHEKAWAEGGTARVANEKAWAEGGMLRSKKPIEDRVSASSADAGGDTICVTCAEPLVISSMNCSRYAFALAPMMLMRGL